MQPLLLLWDIDGTLLQRASAEHAAAIREALGAVHSVAGSGGTQTAYAGRTDGAIARDLLLAEGLSVEAIDAGVGAVMEAACVAYDRLAPASLADKVTPGIPDLLTRLAAATERYRLSLVTGNFERVARLKLDRAGIGHYFEAAQGGFGSDAEDRAELPAVARARAGDWPRDRTVVIGDTPLDIACARADGVRVIAVTTGPFGAVDLADADAVCDSPAAIEPVLADWL